MNKIHPVKEIALTLMVNLTLFFLFFASLAFAQRHDSIRLVLNKDTILYKTIVKVDSITRSFQSKADSLNLLYQRQSIAVRSVTSHLQSMIDSLNHLKIPVEKFNYKIDSLHQLLNDQANSLTKKTEDLKSTVSQSLKEIQLPPPLQESLQKLQSSVENYALPSLTSVDLKKIDIPDFRRWQLPSLGNQMNLDTHFGNIDGIKGTIKELPDNYGQEAQQLLNSNIDDPGNLDRVIERKLLDMEGAEQLREGTALFRQTEQFDSAALAEKANEMVKEAVIKAAKNHFEGKQELLQKAMRDLTKLKNRYEEIPSMATLPKRLPNPLRGKPFIERIIPAITFQVLKSDYFLLDINPMLMYRIHPGVTAGIGWNQRLPLDGWPMMDQETVYGPRAALEVRWKKGIHFRLLPEFMNTVIPKMVAQAKGVDETYREWVGSLFVGIKKDYTVYKKIKGNTEVLYNLFDPEGLSPYGDRLSLRFGFDFPTKKKNRG